MKMVRNYIKKTKAAYSLETLKEAVSLVRNGVLNSYQASKNYNIPRSTIVDRVKQRRGAVKDTKGRPPVIDTEHERRLANALHIMEKNGFGLSSQETLEAVAVFTKKNKLVTPFKNNKPGYDWFMAFRKRHGLSLKKPQGVELSRKVACDPFIINDYFEKLEEYIMRLKIQDKPAKLWNLDESSFSKDPDKTKIVGKRGFSSTRTITSGGKDNVTVLFTVSAAGEKLPPLIIYRGKNVWDQWMSQNAYEGTSYAATKNGWIDAKVFEKYMLNTVLPHLSKIAPSLLIYDGHSTHIQLHVLEKAKELGIEILKLPSHASHLLQPLDLAVFKSMKVKWDAKILSWQRLHVGEKLSKSQFSEILGEVWMELDPAIISNGFKKGGIYPLNKYVIPDWKYDPQALKRYNEAKIHMKKQQVPTLLSLCLRQLTIGTDVKENGTNNEATIKEGTTDLKIPDIPDTYNTVVVHPSEIYLPGTSKGTSKIQVIEDRILDNQEKVSFENLLLDIVKKGDIKGTVKVQKRKVSKGCEVITHEDFLKQLREKETEKHKKELEKQKKELEKQRKESEKSTKKKTKGKKKMPEIKNKKKQIPFSDESSDSDQLVLNDSYSSEDWNEYCKRITDEQMNISNNSDEEIPSTSTTPSQHSEQEEDLAETRHPKIGDWLVVKFCTQKTVKHFVGNVISVTENIPQIKYLRKNKNSKTLSFHYPDVEDVSELIHDIDVVKFLDEPQITRRGYVIFKEHFEGLNIQ